AHVEQRSHQSTRAAACANEPVQPPRLPAIEQICHDAPEYGYREQVEHAEPHEEGVRKPSGFRAEALEQDVETKDVDEEERVEPWQKAGTCDPGGQPAKSRNDEQHHAEDEREAHMKRFVMRAEGVPNRTHDIVTREQEKEVGRRPQ